MNVEDHLTGCTIPCDPAFFRRIFLRIGGGSFLRIGGQGVAHSQPLKRSMHQRGAHFHKPGPVIPQGQGLIMGPAPPKDPGSRIQSLVHHHQGNPHFRISVFQRPPHGGRTPPPGQQAGVHIQGPQTREFQHSLFQNHAIVAHQENIRLEGFQRLQNFWIMRLPCLPQRQFPRPGTRRLGGGMTFPTPSPGCGRGGHHPGQGDAPGHKRLHDRGSVRSTGHIQHAQFFGHA